MLPNDEHALASDDPSRRRLSQERGETMPLLARLLVTGSLIVMTAHVANAQSPNGRSTSVVFGPAAAAMIATFSTDNASALGIVMGLEKRLSEALAVSAIATAARGFATRDDITICRPAPDDGCLVQLLPRRLTTLEVNASVRLLPHLPVRLVAGIGVAIASEARESWRGARATHSGVEMPQILRFGAELPLGTAPYAPRLVLTRARFSPQPFALRRLDGVAILFPR
jgi:hypothetical protein